MAFELLGPSLEDLFAFCDYRFSLKTCLMILDQLLVRLKAIHSKGYIHQDVKPANFLAGTGVNGNAIYITDFGISRNFKSEAREEDDASPPPMTRVIGTTRFASIRAHQGRGT